MIGFIGAGRAGCSLARYFRANGESISGFYSRSDVPEDFAAFKSAAELAENSDTVFISVPDSAISSVWKELGADNARGRYVYHISGAESSDVFCGADMKMVCSAHPMLAFSSKNTPPEQIKRAFFTLEGGDDAVRKISELLMHCGNRYAVISADVKPLYHASACFASNFVTAVCAEAEKMLCRCGFSGEDALSALVPLIEGNVENICAKGIRRSLTGPVVRGDVNTVKKHLSVLEGERKDIYRLLSSVLAEISGHNEMLPLLKEETGNE